MNQQLPKIVSGDGTSPETAVQFEPCTVSLRVAAEREFICSRFGTQGIHWTEQMHFTSRKFQSVWQLALEDGSEVSVYFETKGTIYDD